jgi:hypothetical protein
LGIAAARKRGVAFGRHPGQRAKSALFAPKFLKLAGEGQSYREIRPPAGAEQKYGPDIVKRDRAA